MDTRIKQNSIGFFEISDKPPPEELQSYYAEKYYQQPEGQYQKSYDDSELKYLENRARTAYSTLKLLGHSPSSMLELGCGEGFFADYFFRENLKIVLNDFSKAGLSTFNPHLLQFLSEGDADVFMKELYAANKRFDFISLDNVLEHVAEPSGFTQNLQRVMHKDSIVRITVPNDFSSFQQALVKANLTTETWICPPQHLSYFNTENLNPFFESLGFKVLSMQVDFPIEQFLVNPHSNYWKDRSLGKGAHQARVFCTNYLADKDIEEYIRFCESAAKLGFGRDISVYIALNE